MVPTAFLKGADWGNLAKGLFQRKSEREPCHSFLVAEETLEGVGKEPARRGKLKMRGSWGGPDSRKLLNRSPAQWTNLSSSTLQPLSI